jgi:hypothetical protein
VQRHELAETLETMKVLEHLELALASFYGLCGESAANGLHFWATLAREERQHAETIRRIAAILAERPDRFEPNRTFHVTAIQTFRAYVESLAERLRTGEISRSDQHHLLSLARDVEQSVLEGKWNEIVKTADGEFQALIQAVVSETMAHKAKIVARLAVTPKRV